MITPIDKLGGRQQEATILVTGGSGYLAGWMTVGILQKGYYRIMSGELPAVPNVGFSIPEVRDLVDLHIRAMGKSEAANQRFIGMSDFLWLAEIAETLKKSFPDRAAKISTRRMPDFAIRLSALFQEEARFLRPMLGKREEFNHSKAIKLLQWTPRSPREAVVECARSMVQTGLDRMDQELTMRGTVFCEENSH